MGLSADFCTSDTSLISTDTRLHAALLATTVSVLGTGEYWCEYCRFYTADDIGELAKECGQPIPLPTDFDRRRELLKGIDRRHCRLADVTGGSATQLLVVSKLNLDGTPSTHLICGLLLINVVAWNCSTKARAAQQAGGTHAAQRQLRVLLAQLL